MDMLLLGFLPGSLERQRAAGAEDLVGERLVLDRS
jgi:hypothetical protein